MGWLASGAANEPDATALGAGASVAVLCNFVNNLPMGLLAGTVARRLSRRLLLSCGKNAVGERSWSAWLPVSSVWTE
jgi:Na+/H+ antiporter NhaD/arsenite permease-like protein